MTEMQAAIGRVQLHKLPEWTAIRRRNAAMLSAGFAKIPALRVIKENGGRRTESKVKAGIGPDRRLPAAGKAGETSLMFWVHPTLGADEMRDTCRVVEKVMLEAQR